MLKQMRTALKGVVAWFVIVLLVLAFALWGVPELRNFAQRSPLTVGDVGFSQQQILNEFNRQMSSRRAESGGDYTRERALAEGLPDTVISSLATRSVMEQEAEKMGLVMPRAIVRDTLQSDERFQNPASGQFDEFVLRSILQQNSMSVGQFEAALKSDMLRTQIIDAVTAAPAPPAALVEALLLREVERRRVSYLMITADLAGPAAEPTPEALRTYYEANPAPFTAPEFRTFTVAILRPDDFRDGLAASEEELRKIYEANKARLYDLPEKRTLYQITFDSEAAAQAAVAALGEGRPFETLASERGLTLEAVTFTEVTKRDLLDPGVADAAFAPDLAVGGVSGPVKSLFGWTVIQLAGLKPPETKTFDEVRAELEAQSFEQDTRRRMLDAIDEIEEARDTGAALSAAAEQAGVSTATFGPLDASGFGPNGDPVMGVPTEIRTAAFRLDEGEESEALDLSEGDGYFLVQTDAVTPPTLRPYEEVAAEVDSRWRAEEQEKRIAETIGRLKTAIEGGKSLEDAAAELNRAPLVVILERDTANEVFSPSVVREIFLADRDALISGPFGFGAGEVLARVDEIGYGRNRIGPAEQAQFEQFVGYTYSQELLEAYVAALREDYGVKADASVVAQIFSDGQ